MHMWMWFGYDLGEFLFSGLTINSRWSFAITWIVLFFVAFLFEASKVYLASVQREAIRKLYPYRSDERRTLLCDREQGNLMEPTTSRNTSTGPVSRWDSLKVRVLMNLYQSSVFVLHNLVGYLLMLAVMIYNVHLLLAVVFGMMLGYFLFGAKLTRLQMQCFGRKRLVICTPECDDTAQTSTPPLLDSASDDSDVLICQTRTCIQPSHYFRANTSDAASGEPTATCSFGAKQCPSKVARAKSVQQNCNRAVKEKEDGKSVEDVQLLRTETQGCCKKKSEPPATEKCCKSSSHVEATAVVHETDVSNEEDSQTQMREESPQITCCHNAKSAPTESQEQIVQ